jgi:UDP-glucose 4-epimerase
MTIAVIGAGGYVGGRLVQHLRASGADVVPISRRRRTWLGASNVELDLLADPPSDLDDALAGAGTVVHVAGHDEVVAARDPERALTETVAMTQRVAEAALRAGTGRVVYLSTVHVYGAQMRPGALITEDVLPQPRSIYAIARLTSEHLLDAALTGAAEVVSLRLTNSVGAPAAVDVDRWSLLVNDLCRQAARSDRLVLQTPGLQRRDWVSLGDVCGAIGDACRADAVPPGTYNLGSGTTASVREIAELVAAVWAAVTGEHPEVDAPEATDVAPEPYQVDVGRLAALGVRLDTPIDVAVEEAVRFCARHRADLA